MTITARTTITLPRARFDQLAAIAAGRDLPNPAALIEVWIKRAVAEGELPPEPPGFSCQRAAGGFLISIKDHVLPVMKADRARLLAALLSAAGDEHDPDLSFAMPSGKPVVIDLGDHSFATVRAGRGVRFILKPKDGTEGAMFTAPPALVADLARLIRSELD